MTRVCFFRARREGSGRGGRRSRQRASAEATRRTAPTAETAACDITDSRSSFLRLSPRRRRQTSGGSEKRGLERAWLRPGGAPSADADRGGAEGEGGEGRRVLLVSHSLATRSSSWPWVAVVVVVVVVVYVVMVVWVVVVVAVVLLAGADDSSGSWFRVVV